MKLSPAELLTAGAEALDQPLEGRAHEQLTEFVALLGQWNRTHNLTAITNPRQMVIQHVLDTMAIVPYLRPGAVLDLGTGGGIPGLPLAILLPERKFTLLDSRRKKTEFLRFTCNRLDLCNVDVVCSRIEDYRPDRKFDTLTARALMSVGDLLTVAEHLLEPPVRVVHMKGQEPVRELSQLAPEIANRTRVVNLEVPYLDARRCAVLTDY